MTFYKHSQTDGSGNWFLHLIAKLFKIQCKSKVENYHPGPLHCEHLCWHQKKHHDSNFGIGWCYGDEFFE